MTPEEVRAQMQAHADAAFEATKDAPLFPVRENRTCLSYWFPKIKEAGLPVPRTWFYRMDEQAGRDIFSVFDGKPMGPAAVKWMSEFKSVAQTFGLPCFLRTGQTSNKHHWKDTCHLADIDNLEKQVINLIEFSECCDMMGIPWNVWVLRELLPVEPIFHAFYGRMPIVREFRCFAVDGKIRCVHPYWPERSIEENNPSVVDWCERLEFANRLDECRRREVESLAADASRACGGAWSVDVLWTNRGWYVTDMAEAARSFHWDGCPVAKEFE